MNNVGLTILEGVSMGNSPYKDPSKRNIGLLIESTRGVPNMPVKIHSLGEFNSIFGGQNPAFLGPAVVKNLFDESGGANVTVYIARALDGTAEVAVGSGLLGTSNIAVRAGYKGQDDPGEWGNSLKVFIYSYGYKMKDAFLLTVVQGSEVVETFAYSTLAELESTVNKVSKYITVTIDAEVAVTYTPLTGSITTTTANNTVTGEASNFFTSLKAGDVLYKDSKVVGTIQKVVSDTLATLVSRAQQTLSSSNDVAIRNDIELVIPLSSGTSGSTTEEDFYVGGTSTYPTGIACFKGYDIQVLACTEYHSLSMAKALNAYLQDDKTALGLINLPITADEGTAELYASELQTTGISYVAGIMGWVKVPNSQGSVIVIPALGAWIGAGFLRTPHVNGGHIHTPPAGIDSLLTTVIDVIPKRLQQQTLNNVVVNSTCNIIQYVENVGFYIGTSRTYSTNDLYRSIHVRQQTSFYRQKIVNMLRYVEQKPNTPELKRQALIDLRTFFKEEYDKGGLERSVPFEVAYQGICDISNNPISQDRKLINIDVLWIPTECTESVSVSLQRNDGVLTITEK